MRIMYDAVNPAAIPVGAALVAGYVNGPKSVWPAEAWSRFPGSHLVRIDVLGNAAKLASVLDVETGDVKPEDAPNWIRAREVFAPGSATIYCNRDSWDNVRKHCAGLNPHWWIGDWTGTPHQLAGAVAVQYASPTTGSEGQYDLSAVWDDTWHAPPTWVDRALGLVMAIDEAAQTLQPLLNSHRG